MLNNFLTRIPLENYLQCTISDDQLDAISSMTNGYEVYENEEYLEATSIKEEPISEEEAPGDLPLDCMLCAKCFRTTSGLRAHVVTDHHYKTVKRKSGNNSPRCGKTRRSSSDTQTSDKKQRYICSMCRRVFVTSTDLRVHETCHSKFFCFACNARFDTFKEVTRHRQRCKVKPQTVKLKTLSDVMKARAQLALLEVNTALQHSARSDEHKDNILLQIFKTGESTKKANNISEVVEKAVGLEKKKELNVAIKQEKDGDEDEIFRKIESELRTTLGLEDNKHLDEKCKSSDKKCKEEMKEDAQNIPEAKETETPQTEKEAKNAEESVKVEKIEIEINRIDINEEVQLEVEHMQDSETNSIAPSVTNSDYTDTTRDQDVENDTNDSDFTDSMKYKDLVNNEHDEQSKSVDCDINGEKRILKSNTFVIERIEEII